MTIILVGAEEREQVRRIRLRELNNGTHWKGSCCKVLYVLQMSHRVIKSLCVVPHDLNIENFHKLSLWWVNGHWTPSFAFLATYTSCYKHQLGWGHLFLLCLREALLFSLPAHIVLLLNILRTCSCLKHSTLLQKGPSTSDRGSVLLRALTFSSGVPVFIFWKATKNC